MWTVCVCGVGGCECVCEVWVGGMVCLNLLHTVFSPRFVNTVAFHPDGNCIAVGTTDNVIKVLYRNS